jgi:hypothetical protein
MLHISSVSTPLYYIASIFPFLSVIISWVIFYSIGHSIAGRVLTISETVAPFPECRIFSISMCIESIFIFLLFSIRNLLFTSHATQLDKSNDSAFLRYKWAMWILTFGSVIGMIVVSVVTVSDHLPVHLFGAFALFGCAALYFLIGDFALRFASFKLNLVSWMLSWLSIGLAIVFLVLDLSAGGRRAMKNAASIFQYLLALTMFVKVFFSQYDLPKFYITGSEEEV